ncbi:ATP-binding protein [Sulfurirhabdus autotrophica]|uniref:HMA domain-containing protein n=1 Tax=Sulfurirhabdus autotrophica TaxID=1706046 RepID=A0A4V2W314_9PROT|nr:ATP-binding protein [Sulfurirhabdus autotrophica]TCV90119.1 hypothetical protein EDC63_10186 [Sulfurirhabdus autotrophica]
MSNHIVDIEVHIDESLNEGSKADLVEYIRHLEGVVSVGFSLEKSHLMFVGYNTNALQAKDIIDRVQKKGVHAELIGL